MEKQQKIIFVIAGFFIFSALVVAAYLNRDAIRTTVITSPSPSSRFDTDPEGNKWLFVIKQSYSLSDPKKIEIASGVARLIPVVKSESNAIEEAGQNKVIREETYPTDSPYVSTVSGIAYTGLSGFHETLGTHVNGTIRYQLSPNGTDWYYRNTFATRTQPWEKVTSDDQANVQGQVNSHISEFSGQFPNATLYVKAFLQAEDESEGLELAEISIDISATPAPGGTSGGTTGGTDGSPTTTDGPSAPEKHGPRGNVQLANTILTVPMNGTVHVRSFATTGQADNPQTNFFPYNTQFTGGASIATGDVDGDGKDEIIVAAGKGFGPNVKIFSKSGSQKSIQFVPFHPSYKGQISIAAGDVDGDGKDEIGVCQSGEGDQSFCKVYQYATDKPILAYWKAFGDVLVGANLAFGDIDGDGVDEAITGASAGGGPQIRVFDIGRKRVTGIEQGARLKPNQFFAFDENSRAGIVVASGDVDGDGKYEIAAVQQAGQESTVVLYRFNSAHTRLANFRAYPAGQITGASLVMADVDGDGKAEIITGSGSTSSGLVHVFDAQGKSRSTDITPYADSFRGGVNVGAGKF